jgi:hypothetical protein
MKLFGYRSTGGKALGQLPNSEIVRSRKAAVRLPRTMIRALVDAATGRVLELIIEA